MGRWLGGVFGNTKLATDTSANVTGVYTISDQYHMRREGGWLAPLGSQSRPAVDVAELLADGITTNGYYWLKGTGSVNASTTRQFYCILDSSFPLGAGWTVIANHDGSKKPNAAHQARPTSWDAFMGYDNASGNANVGDYPYEAVMIPERSFSCNMKVLPFTKFVHAAYNNTNMSTPSSSNWLNPLAYYGGTWNSAQTIPNSQSWALPFNTTGVTFNNYQRRISYSGSYAAEVVGCFNDSVSTTNPYVQGSGAQTQAYPVYVGAWGYNSGNGSTGTFSFCDSGGPSSTASDTGWDDFQDGSGMGDSWNVENQGANTYRGYPSYILVG